MTLICYKQSFVAIVKTIIATFSYRTRFKIRLYLIKMLASWIERELLRFYYPGELVIQVIYCKCLTGKKSFR